jgi:membrane associated rhomboid family serine protease
MTNEQPAGADWQRSGPLGEAQARQLLELAAEQAQQGEYEAASALYSRLVGQGDPLVHVAALLGLADSRYRLDDEAGALQAWIVATQAPETPLSWRAWVALAGARVRQADLPAAARAYREAERRAPTEEQPQIASRLGWLNKEMGRTWSAQRYFGRARTGAFTPLATWVILAVTVGVSLWTMLTPATGARVLELLMLDKQAVQAGEWWRLLTVTLVHANLIHLLFNMYALYIVGPIVEALYGRVLFVTFYLLSAAVASVASYLFFANPSVGASGAVFGLFGLLLLSTWVHKPALGRQARLLTRQIGLLIVINLAIGFGLVGFGAVRVDNAAHIGGLITGAWLGLAVVPRGMATLASFWRRVPAPGDGQTAGMAGPAGTAGPAGMAGPAGLLRLAAILIVVVVIFVGLSVTPLWD